MTGTHDQLAAGIARTGDALLDAWKREEAQERRRGRRRRRVGVVVMSTLALSVPTGLAARSWFTSSPVVQHGRALVLARGSSDGQQWELTAFSRGTRQCFGLRAGGSQWIYGSVCDGAFPTVRRVSVGTQSAGSGTLVYGAVADGAPFVTVAIDGVARRVATRPPQSPGKLRRRLPEHLRIFVVRIPGTHVQPPDVRLP